jgi:hypothetical protein
MMAKRAVSVQPIPWQERNQSALVEEFAALRRRLDGEPVAVKAGESAGGSPTAIDALTEIFKLSAFERELLLLLAGVEMDTALAAWVEEVAGAKRSGGDVFAGDGYAGQSALERAGGDGAAAAMEADFAGSGTRVDDGSATH